MGKDIPDRTNRLIRLNSIESCMLECIQKEPDRINRLTLDFSSFEPMITFKNNGKF